MQIVAVVKKTFPFLLLLAALAALSGCSSANNDFRAAFSSADYPKAASISATTTGNSSTDKTLWLLQTGISSLLAGNSTAAISALDAAESAFKAADERSAAGSSLNYTASLLYNDNALPYDGTTSDRILANTYKALAFMLAGNSANARVELNRALARQDRAKNEYAAEIRKTREQQQDAARKNSAVLKPGTSTDSIIDQLHLEQTYSNIANFRAYPDFVNPFATYLAGLFNLLDNDLPKALDLLKETSGMVPENQFAFADFSAAGQRQLPRNRVWVIIENGLAPERIEQRADLPAWIFTSKVYYTGIAFPVLREIPALHTAFNITANGASTRTQVIADMDRVIRTEYQKHFRAILTREILRAIVKTAAQYESGRRDDKKDQFSFYRLGAALYQQLTTHADLRSWWTIPKNYQIASLPIPADRKILITPADILVPTGTTPPVTPISVQIPDCENAIVYYRAPITLGASTAPRVICWGAK